MSPALSTAGSPRMSFAAGSAAASPRASFVGESPRASQAGAAQPVPWPPANRAAAGSYVAACRQQDERDSQQEQRQDQVRCVIKMLHV